MGLLSLEHVRQAELMDDPGLPEAEHRHALDALATKYLPDESPLVWS